MRNDNRLLLAGDIGGTKTTLALFTPDGGTRRPLAQATYASTEHDSLEGIVAQFLRGKHVRVTEASFGVAGPVVEEGAQVTNLAWRVDGRLLSRVLDGAPVHIYQRRQPAAELGRLARSIALAQAGNGAG